MTKLKLDSRAALLMGIMLSGALAGCGGGSSGSGAGTLQISGTLYDGQTRALRAARPVVGAVVSACGGSDITDNSGAFSFEVAPEGCAGGNVQFTFSGAVSGTAVVNIASTTDQFEVNFGSDDSGEVYPDSINEIDDDSGDDDSIDDGDDDSSDDSIDDSGDDSSDDFGDDDGHSSGDHGSSDDDEDGEED